MGGTGMGCFSFIRKSKNREDQKIAARPVDDSSPPPSKPSTEGSEDSNVKASAKGSDDPISNGSISKSSPSTPSQSKRSLPALYEERARKLRVFELVELQSATDGFNRALKIGEGGFGNVYKGFIRSPDGEGERIVVAIKQLNQRSLQGHKQWLAEVQFLAVVEHPNLVKLIGYCSQDGERRNQRLLVYEFMPNKSLDDHLFSRAYPPLSWKSRLQIILGAAQGLAYLHEGLEIQVIYRDFKASNILLDEEFKPKLSDFGLAREGPTGGNTHVSTAVLGTYGYAAPDYIQTGHLTIKSDVWSFGVVLYEILTGRRSLERNLPPGEQKLLNWVRQYPPENRNFYMIMDLRLRNQYPLKAAREVAKLANWCLSKNPKDRPKMTEVVEILELVMLIEPKERLPSVHNSDEGTGTGTGLPPDSKR